MGIRFCCLFMKRSVLCKNQLETIDKIHGFQERERERIQFTPTHTIHSHHKICHTHCNFSLHHQFVCMSYLLLTYINCHSNSYSCLALAPCQIHLSSNYKEGGLPFGFYPSRQDACNSKGKANINVKDWLHPLVFSSEIGANGKGGFIVAMME